jgi:hypothetical protein
MSHSFFYFAYLIDIRDWGKTSHHGAIVCRVEGKNGSTGVFDFHCIELDFLDFPHQHLRIPGVAHGIESILGAKHTVRIG